MKQHLGFGWGGSRRLGYLLAAISIGVLGLVLWRRMRAHSRSRTNSSGRICTVPALSLGRSVSSSTGSSAGGEPSKSAAGASEAGPGSPAAEAPAASASCVSAGTQGAADASRTLPALPSPRSAFLPVSGRSATSGPTAAAPPPAAVPSSSSPVPRPQSSSSPEPAAAPSCAPTSGGPAWLASAGPPDASLLADEPRTDTPVVVSLGSGSGSSPSSGSAPTADRAAPAAPPVFPVGVAAAAPADDTAAAAAAAVVSAAPLSASLQTSSILDVSAADAAPPFRVLSYNLLAPGYVRPARYAYCEPHWLDWAVRREALLSRIVGLAADVVCLQELEEADFAEFFHPRLQAAGYEGAYLRKGLGKPDGVAIFCRSQRFAMVRLFGLRFAEHPAFSGQPNEQVALIAILADLEVPSTPGDPPPASPLLAVGTTHAAGHPALGELRRLQVQTLADVMHGLLQPLVGAHHLSGAVLCGDLNADPDSAAYAAAVQHPLGLRSSQMAVHGREPACTFRTDVLQHTVDYVFYTAGSLRAVAGSAWDEPMRPMPHAIEPSDHVPLWADLEWDARGAVV